MKKVSSFAIRNAPSDDSDQTARMRKLVSIFALRTCLMVRFFMLQLSMIFIVLYLKHNVIAMVYVWPVECTVLHNGHNSTYGDSFSTKI